MVYGAIYVTESVQLSLFGDESLQASPKEAISEMTWSYSRRSILEQCNRRYYYEYFGANKRIAKQEADKDRLHFLKQLKNRYLRTGEILHLVIGTYFRKAQIGERWDADRLVGWALDILGADQLYSQNYPNSELPDTRFPPTLLREYYYDLPNADLLISEAQERLVNALQSFANSELYGEFRQAGSMNGALIEKHFRLSELPCLVRGQIDLAYRTEESVTVVDWKLGTGDGTGDNSLQLAAYALWALERYGCDPSMLQVYKAHLTSNDIVSFRADAEVLAAAQARIVQDAERMVALQEYGVRASVEAFTPCWKPMVCRECQYERVCYA